MLDWKFIAKTIVQCAGGIPETIMLVVVSLVIAIPIAFIMAVVNLKPERVASKILQIYISFVRSLPLILIIYLFYHLIPLLVAAFFQSIG